MTGIQSKDATAYLKKVSSAGSQLSSPMRMTGNDDDRKKIVAPSANPTRTATFIPWSTERTVKRRGSQTGDSPTQGSAQEGSREPAPASTGDAQGLCREQVVEFQGFLLIPACHHRFVAVAKPA